jgi:O-antigen/teichoic acid export membrane protein
MAAPWIAGDAGAAATDALRFGALLIPAIAWSRQRQGALQGLGRVAVGQVPELLLQPALLFALLGAGLMLNRLPTQASKVLLLQTCAAILTAAAGTWLLRSALPRASRHSAPAPVGMAWLRAAAPFTLLLLMTLALGQIDTLMLGAIRGAAEAGPYRAASQIAAFTAFPMTAINLAAAPRLAACYAAGDVTMLRRISRRAVVAGAVMGFLIAAVLWIFGALLLRMFGPGFDAAYRPLSLLTGAYALTTLAGTSGYLLIMSRHATAAALLFTTATVISIGAQALFIPSWGPLGAAAGTSLALCLLTVGLIATARRVIRPAQPCHHT